MEQGIVTIIIVAVIFIVAAQYLQTDNPQFGLSGGPLATGSNDSAIQNPQPIGTAAPAGNARRASDTNQQKYRIQGQKETEDKKIVQPKSGYSRYENTVVISRVQRSVDPTKEYVILRNGTFFNRTEASVPISGWTIESRKSGKITIPAAEEIPLIDAGTQSIILPQGGEVTITSGVTTFGRSFRENICTGYFTQNRSFIPPLASCTAIPFNTQELLDAGYNSECVNFVKSIARCRIPVIPYEKSGRIGNACIEYVTDTYSYAGCVARFRPARQSLGTGGDEKTFFKKTWRIFLNQPAHIFDTLHDRVILRDDKGLIVDEFEY